MEDVEKIKMIAANNLKIIAEANKEPEERQKNIPLLKTMVFALKAIANETKTMQDASKITREINAVIKAYNAYTKQFRADARKRFIDEHVVVLVNGKEEQK